MLGDLFSNIQVQRVREDIGKTYIRVPITYASKEHFMMKLNKWTSVNNEDGPAKVETILPRINLHLVDMMYNPTYKTGQLNRSAMSNPNSKTGTISQYNPTPIKMIFELGIFTRHQDDMFQIVEQIMPYFQPHFNTTMTELFENEITFERDIRITFQSISIDEQIEGEKQSRRRLEWAIMFEVNGWLYPPAFDLSGEIRTIYLDFHANSRELVNEGVFESVDSEVDPRDVEIQDWDGKSIQKYDSDSTPIPKEPEPPGPRGV
ncbi:gp15 tail sheath stabilizer and completion protein [Enterobacter phage CC31]|uniref:Tail sheath stabilizer and completion n=2 Tax=Karamvirus TaxID=1913650 RepID=A0A2R3ZXA8_9CAUD|nr:gp15 tail sheath stabilizer and completion protein [Enterobacter phage CC31]YP_010094052.1 tail sheath stabilizer and completion [Enterobacter phage myPSH1140]ADB81663.1 gp15 tail sheath stabilizer and completion protein [Enterobacter phage CC31]AVR55354.1 tail sheath stabilizer and completion [Enterobacter phage myPSH1140]